MTEIRVDGLKDFQRELRRLDKEFPKELRQANKEAAEIVATATRQSQQRRPGVAPKVAKSVKVLAQQRSSSVRIGGRRFPYALGSEFGSKQYRQFPNLKRGGYSLYPAIKANRDRVVEQYGEAIDDLMRRAFPRG